MALTNAELNFYTQVPHYLLEIFEELKKINKNLEKANERAETGEKK